MYSPPTPALRQVRGLAHLALVALALDCLVGLAAAVIDMQEIAIINRMIDAPDSVSDAEIETSDAIYAASAIVVAAVFVVAAVMFLIWLFRVRANAEVLAPGEHRYGRPWVVFGWMVPIISFWYPKQIVDDIWGASHRAGTGPSPRSGLVTVWWASLMIASLVSNVAGRMFRADDLEGMALAAKYDIVSIALWLVAAAPAALVISRITGAQEARRLAPSVAPAY
ncbi:DUF4328 domain-containing protein [Nonomuraea cavernae]|uniref:DUF4328 domain-containing protein n=1 Tax=Nonomuraea cavernae TaxID=2045107 RepID=UPI0033EB0D1A